MEFTEETHSLILNFYKIRCDVEGITKMYIEVSTS